MKHPKVDILIAAYNEEKTISSIISIVLQIKHRGRIIIVDDGSTDNTYKIASSFGNKIILLKTPKNSGKSEAIALGLTSVTAPIVFLCDADLKKFTLDMCHQIIKPVLSNQVGMNVAQRNYGNLSYQIVKHLDSFSGQRAVKTDILKYCSTSKYFYNFGIESVLNYYCRVNNIKTNISVMDYDHSSHLVKKGIVAGILSYTHMVYLIGKIYLTLTINHWH